MATIIRTTAIFHQGSAAASPCRAGNIRFRVRHVTLCHYLPASRHYKVNNSPAGIISYSYYRYY